MTHPMKITVADQKEGKITGTVTFHEGAVSFPVQSTIQVSGGKTTLVVYVTHFEFTVEQGKLDGYGYGPRHQGPAVLTRRSPAAGVTSDPQRWVGEWVGTGPISIFVTGSIRPSRKWWEIASREQYMCVVHKARARTAIATSSGLLSETLLLSEDGHSRRSGLRRTAGQ